MLSLSIALNVSAIESTVMYEAVLASESGV